MKKITTFMAAIGTGLMFMATASAAPIVQTFTLGSVQTEVNTTESTGTFNDWGYYVTNSLVPANAVLSSVSLQFSGNETLTYLVAINSTGANQTFDFALNGNFHVGGTAAAADLSSLNATAAFTNGLIYSIGDAFDLQAIANGATQNYIPGPAPALSAGVVIGNPTGILSVTGTVTAANPGNYVGSGCTAVQFTAGCDFTLNYQTATNQSGISIGNLFTSGIAGQIVTSGGTETVTYNYTIPSGTPEPTTMILFGSGLIGLGLLRKRTAAKN